MPMPPTTTSVASETASETTLGRAALPRGRAATTIEPTIGSRIARVSQGKSLM